LTQQSPGGLVADDNESDLRRLAADLKGLGFDADAIEGAIGQKSPKEIT